MPPNNSNQFNTNAVPALFAVSNVDGMTPVYIWADPTAHSLLVNATLTGSTVDSLITELRIMNGAMAMRVDDTGSGTLYQGWAEPGTATSSAAWRIRRIVTSGTPEDTTITWADGDRDFNYIWDNRTSLSYS